MKKIVIASGKGGTGKTTLAINLAFYLSLHESKKVKLLDCDVEAPNDNIFLNAKFDKSKDVTASRPIWKEEQCIACGKCATSCNYNAIAKTNKNILIFNELCHSCGVCEYICPNNALEMRKVPIGKIELADKSLPFSFGHGVLNIGESLAPLVIKELKNTMSKDEINIIDAPPGTTCPVVQSMENMDYCILVTEPTPFGLNDLTLAAKLAAKMKIPVGIVINRSYGEDEIIEEFSKAYSIPIIGKIPYNKKYAKSYSTGEVLIKKHPELLPIFSTIFKKIEMNKIIPKFQEEPDEVINDLAIDLDDQENTIKHKDLVIISGKGGTGKTTITSSLSKLMDNKVLADNDVDASNLHILCNPTPLRSDIFIGGSKYYIDNDKCINCGACESVCNYNAIKEASSPEEKYAINELFCEGCGFCSHVCNVEAISKKDSKSGKWHISDTQMSYLSHAKLGIGEENSGKLVTVVRNNASYLADHYSIPNILRDGPPGTGCPVISSITGADLALIVTEPTLSGLHDMKRALDLTKYFKIRSLIVVNKYDINTEITTKIISMASDYDSKVIGKIPFDKKVNEALTKGQSIITYGEGIAYEAILDLWKNLKENFYEC